MSFGEPLLRALISPETIYSKGFDDVFCDIYGPIGSPSEESFTQHFTRVVFDTELDVPHTGTGSFSVGFSQKPFFVLEPTHGFFFQANLLFFQKPFFFLVAHFWEARPPAPVPLVVSQYMKVVVSHLLRSGLCSMGFRLKNIVFRSRTMTFNPAYLKPEMNVKENVAKKKVKKEPT